MGHESSRTNKRGGKLVGGTRRKRTEYSRPASAGGQGDDRGLLQTGTDQTKGLTGLRMDRSQTGKDSLDKKAGLGNGPESPHGNAQGRTEGEWFVRGGEDRKGLEKKKKRRRDFRTEQPAGPPREVVKGGVGVTS